MSLEGRVAIVNDGGSELGRAIALALAARGVSIVICGSDEKLLGETVGHLVYAGGKARHVVGTPADAAARARDVFAAPTIVINDTSVEAKHRVIVEAATDVDLDHVAQLVVALCAAKPTGRILTLRVS